MCGILDKLEAVLRSEWGIPIILFAMNIGMTALYKLAFSLHQRFKWAGWAYAEASLDFVLTALSWLMANRRHPPDQPEVKK